MIPVDPRIDPALVPDGSRAVVMGESQQDEYIPLPSVRTPQGHVITRWRLSESERAAVGAGEDIFITLVSHGPINPLFATVGPTNWKEQA